MRVYTIGCDVVAVEEVIELGLIEEGVKHVHARAGDRGVVRVIDGEWLLVTWSATGTTSDCHVTDLR